MGYKAGKDLLIKVDFGLGAGFQTVGGIQRRSVKLGDTSKVVTNQDSEGNWQEMLSGVASKTIAISGDGVAKTGPVLTGLMQMWTNQSPFNLNWQVITPGLGTLEGPFALQGLEFSGDQEDVVKFSISLGSAGPIGFTPDASL